MVFQLDNFATLNIGENKDVLVPVLKLTEDFFFRVSSKQPSVCNLDVLGLQKKRNGF